MTDHISSTNFFKQPKLNAPQAQWTSFLREFDFDVKDLKGKQNGVAYALYRKLKCINEITFSQIKFYFSNWIREFMLKDHEYQFLWKQAK